MNNDLISRKALQEEIAGVKKHIYSENSDYLTGYICALSGMEGLLAGFPAIDPERIVVLPCKVGAKIYAVGHQGDVWQIKECEAEEFVIDKRRNQVLVNFECDQYCEGCPFNSWAQEYSGEWSCDGEYEQAIIDFDAFGDWVFLTREEAEAALRKEGMKR